MVDYQNTVKDFFKLVKLRTNKPDLAELGKIMRAFQRFPFENLTKIVIASKNTPENSIRTPDIVLDDHVDFGAGGTCFSLNFFLQKILEHVGYEVYPVICDRSYGPNTHCALIGRIDGEKYLIDPGYLMLEPMPIPKFGNSSQKTHFNTSHLIRLGETSQYTFVTEQAKTKKLRYRLKDKPLLEDELKKYWLDSFNWPMMRHICITKIEPNGQVFVRDMNLRFNTIEKKSGEKIRRDFEKRISETFGIDKKIIEEAHETTRVIRKKMVTG